MSMPQQWTYRSLHHDHTRTEPMSLQWEVEGDPISDSFTPSEISAHDLFKLWARKYGDTDDGLVRIYWSIWPAGEAAPLQPAPFDGDNFRTDWSDPVDARTGEPVNWLALPVLDKRWNARQADKGGFIQEATGWKPSALQPYVTYAALVAAAAATQRD